MHNLISNQRPAMCFPAVIATLCSAVCLLALLGGCGSAKRLVGEENMLPRKNSLVITTLERERIAGTQVTCIASPREHFRADPEQLLYHWSFSEGIEPRTSTLPEPVVTLQPISTASATVAGRLTLSYNDRGIDYTQTYPFELEVEHANPLPPAGELPIRLSGPAIPGALVQFALDPTVDLAGLDGLNYLWEFHPGDTLTSGSTAKDSAPWVQVSALTGQRTGKLNLSIEQNSIPYIRSYTFIYDVTDEDDPFPPDGAYNLAPQTDLHAGQQAIFAVPASMFAHQDGMAYSWDFGTGATPARSVAKEPEVRLGPAREEPYAGRLTMSLTLPDGTFEGNYTFTYTVGPAVPNPDLFPPDGAYNLAPQTDLHAGQQAIFAVPASMFAHQDGMAYAWDFGTGATPALSVAKAPEVKLGAAREEPYAGRLTMSLTLPDGTFEGNYTFTYTVGPAVPNPDPFPPAGEYNFAPDTNLTAGSAVVFEVPGTFFAHQEGMAYAWDFGGGAIPDTASGRKVHVTLGDERTAPYEGTLDVSLMLPDQPAPFTRQYTFKYVVTPQALRVVTIEPQTATAGEVVTLIAGIAGNPANRQLQYQWTVGTLGTVEADSGLDRPAPRILVAAPDDNGEAPDDPNPVPVTVKVWFVDAPDVQAELTVDVQVNE